LVHSKIFVENVRVLAADQMLDNPDNKAMIAKTITVEVTPQQSQMIAIAAEIGKIYMSLRALASEGKPSPAADPNAPLDSPEQAKAKLMEVDAQSLTDTDFVEDPTGVSVSEQVKVLRPGEVQNLNFTRPKMAAEPAGAAHE
jgi:Flp pilus assembly protein CpaB